ncbi:MAG: hypothetical protein K2L02_00245 [Clostridia bacterium]|nr:hypothetical protein [Clostridia bacterium]
MNAWKLVGTRELQKEECSVPEQEEGKLRVRVTKLLLSRVDAEIYRGNVAAKLPLIPGRFAVGQISVQNDNPLFPKNTRVLFHAYREKPDLGVVRKDFLEDDVSLCGMTDDGFMRDFVNVSPDDMTPLPDSISDVDALLVHYISIAKTAVDKLDANKGDRVAVVGADFLGILISQLLIYQQISPILIDSHKERLYFANKCGVYYTMLANDDVIDEVASVTGGRLADKAVYVKTAGEDPTLPATLVARGGTLVSCASDRSGYSVDLGTALRKQIDFSFVTDPEGSLEASINLIVNDAINLEPLKNTIKTIKKPEDFFGNENEDFSIDTFCIHVYNLL